MKTKHLLLILCALLVMSGCSTGPYLKPHASIGWYSTENPACPGAEQVLEFSLGDYDWLVFRVLAKHPTKFHPEGTRLIAYVSPSIYMHPDPNYSRPLFRSEEEKFFIEKLAAERRSQNIEITFSNSLATIIFSDGHETNVELPFFSQPYNYSTSEYYGPWGPEVVISTEKLEEFAVKFPAVYVNGEEIRIPIITFKIDKDKYAPVLNC